MGMNPWVVQPSSFVRSPALRWGFAALGFVDAHLEGRGVGHQNGRRLASLWGLAFLWRFHEESDGRAPGFGIDGGVR